MTDIAAQTLAGIVVARELGAQAFGEFSFAFALVGLLSVILFFGAGDVAITLYSRSDGDPSAVLYATAKLLLRGSLLASAAAVTVVQCVDLPASTTLAVAFAVATLIGNGIAAMLNLAIVAHGASRLDLASVALTRIGLLAGVMLMSTRGQLAAILPVYATSAFALALLRGVHVHYRLFPVRIARDSRIQHELSARARKVGVGSIMGAVTARADTLMLRLYAGPAATGLYAASYRFVNAADALATALATALFPKLIKQLAEDRARARRQYLAVGAVLALLGVCTVPLSGWLTRWVYGREYASAESVLAPLLLAAAAQSCSAFIHKFWIATGRERLLPRAQLCATIVGCGGYGFAIPRYGALGAALATLCSQLTLVAFHAVAFAAERWSSHGLVQRMKVRNRNRNHAFSSVLLGLLLLPSSLVHADWRETKVATQFQLFVPPNNDNGTRYSVVVVTAQSGTPAVPCSVDLVDGAEDGDEDDTVRGAQLVKGQSLVRYIRAGAVNDDAGGKWDGDYFTVSSTQPVSVYMATDSDWQHDWAPSDNGTLRGTRFFLFSNGYSVSKRDIDVFAYEDNTRVELYDISAASLSGSGITSIGARPANPLMSADLDTGEDLTVRRGLGRDLMDQGRTYELVASKPVTVLFGAIASVVPQNQARDGAGFVPGRGGDAIDQEFYFHVPTNPDALYEQEIRMVSFSNGVVARLFGFSETNRRFEEVRAWALDRLDHADYVGGTYRLYRLLTTGGPIVTFEANWMETGSPGTSDDASFAPGLFLPGGAEEFLVYMGPPGNENNTTLRSTLSHLYLFSRAGQSNVRVVDADTLGGIITRTLTIPARGYADVALTTTDYAQLNQPSRGLRPYLRVTSASPLAVNAANWNDNWMAYATATVIDNPQITLSADGVAVVDGPVQLTGQVTNAGTLPLSDLLVQAQLAPGFDYVSGTFAGMSETGVTRDATGTQVSFRLSELAPAATAPISIVVHVGASAGSDGEVTSIAVVASATETGTTVASTFSVPLTVRDVSLAQATDVTAVGGDRRVDLSWSMSGGSGSTQIWVQRSTNVSSGYVTLAGSEQVYQSGSPTTFSYRDSSVSNRTTYYYRLLVQGSDGAETYAGPIIAQPVDTVAPDAPTFTATPGDRSAVLFLVAPSASDVTGCKVFRRVTGSSAWITLTANPVSCSTFSDSGLTNGTSYEYAAKAVDDDKNESVYSRSVSVLPLSPPERVNDHVVFYEDMIGAGNNDWDYNDFVVRIMVGESSQNGRLRRLTFDYEPLARGAGYVQRFRQRVALHGTWSAVLTRYAASGSVVSTESVSGRDDLDLVIFKQTLDALPAATGSYTNTARSQAGEIAGQTARLIVDVVPTPGISEYDGAAPFDPYIEMPYLPAPNSVHLSNAGGRTERTTRLPELAGYALDFAYAIDASDPASSELHWAFEGEPAWFGFPQYPQWVRSGTPERWYEQPRTPSAVHKHAR